MNLAGRIGEPVDRPWVGMQVVLEQGVLLADVEPAITTTVEAVIASLPEFRERLGRGEKPVC